MAVAKGGKRKGAGRPKGAKTIITEAAIKRAAAKANETPLDYMMRVMNDDTQADDRRDKMAMGAAPYVHARGVEVTGKDGGAIRAAMTVAFVGTSQRD